jgi:tetratricopeptide (TPR) repeat protein
LRARIGDGNLEAEAAFEQAIGLNPSNAQAYMWFASLRAAEQRFEDAIGLYHRSMQLDPLGRVPYSNLPTLYAQLGQNEIAIKLLLEAMEIHPDWPTPYQILALQLVGLGRLDEALAWNLAAQEMSDDPSINGNIAVGIYMQFGDHDRAMQQFGDFPADHPLAPLTPGFIAMLDFRFSDALALFRQALEDHPQLPVFVLDVASDVALLADDLELAEKYILQREPRLATDAREQVDRLNVRIVLKLAYIQLRRGDEREANSLLESAMTVVQTMPRLGMFGYGIRDVQIFALMNRKDEAIAAFREAIDMGFRSPIIFDSWLLDVDPFLATIRDDPRFVAMVAELDTLNAPMYQRVLDAEANGSWDALRALAGAK